LGSGNLSHFFFQTRLPFLVRFINKKISKAHGTFIGSIRLEHQKPQQVFVDSELRFGASTRTYIVRERPQINKHFPSMLTSQTSVLNNSSNSGAGNEDEENEEKGELNNSGLSMLPESEAELDVTFFFHYHNLISQFS
jgi:hypothetical protein